MNHVSIQAVETQAAEWRSQADASNPAGPLFIGGEYAEADIIGDTTSISGKCGTACSGSRTRMCC
ncbi:hypothetical protein HNQ51_002558 [Inhella inkyongensis]|uniref:Uncharacterized protein n=1 Tax=Inhella inkyongensis TaxID=392593 RepID=A0A840SA07_9BURK|nr:DUF6229 family protein [Inhella inkyongensis]MBB5205239.1 hypothetical protein [Inhella inkyongensis]